MAVCCNADGCGRPAPADLQWRLIMACSLAHLIDLFGGELKAYRCPHCGAKDSVRPSLAGLLIVESKLLLLDRGTDPEAAARNAIAPLVESVGASPVAERMESFEAFQARFAGLVKATAAHFPYASFNPASPKENLSKWRHLQGDILTALRAGAMGIIPKFGVDARQLDGTVVTREETISLIDGLNLSTVDSWLLGLSTLSRETQLEELLTRLIDSLGAVVCIADEVIERLAALRHLAEEQKAAPPFWLHFEAIEASLLAMMGRTNPHAASWATHYLLARWAAAANPGDDDRFLLSRARVAATIRYEDAWDAVASCVGSLWKIEDTANRNKAIRILAEAADDLGYDGLYNAVWKGGVRIGTKALEGANGHSPEGLARLILEARQEDVHSPWEPMLGIWNLPWLSDAPAVAQFFDLLRPSAMEDIASHADLLAWLGQRMKHLGAPDLGLDRIGREPADWEEKLEAPAKRRLWTERSNMLRLLGDPIAALDVAKAVLDITRRDPEASPQHLATAFLNAGILMRETGRFPEAIRLMLEAIKVAPDADRWMPLQSLATTYIHMQRLAEAVDLLPQVRASAGGADYEGMRSGLLVTETAIHFQLGQFSQAEDLLQQLPPLAKLHDDALIGYATLLMVQGARGRDSEAFQEDAVETTARLVARSNAFATMGNALQAQLHVHSAAELAQYLGLPIAPSLWRADAELSIKAGRAPDVRAAVELAVLDLEACAEPVAETFWDHVDAILTALEQKASGIALNAMTMDLLAPLKNAFQRLATALYAQGFSVNEHQLLAELRRNAHRRALHFAGERMLATRVAVGDAMGADQAPFLVLEWSDLADGDLLGIVSLMNPGDARANYLFCTSEVDLVSVAAAAGTRMRRWSGSRKGQPFEVPGWSEVQRWIRVVADSYLPGGGHVVIIDHPSLLGLPFHIALGPDWTVSYTSSWSALEAAVIANGAVPSTPAIGILHAPRANETAAVRAALECSAQAARDLAEKHDLPCQYAGPGAGDANRLRELLRENEILKVLCHGQQWPEDREVALVVDYEGRSPPGYSYSEALASGTAHRFGREALRGIDDAARTVFLGACSAGVVSIGGLDERTSFSLLLADAGTSTVVAPRWEIDAKLALPILDEVMARFVDGESLCSALTTAAEAAIARGVPTWQAYSFVIEGAWI